MYGPVFKCAMLMAIKQNSGFCWISHRFDNNSYLARLREQMRFTRWSRTLADAMKHDEEEGLVILANSGTDRRNYTKTDIRTQIYRITPLPRPKGWPPTELCFLSLFLVIHFYTNCVKLYGIVTPTVPPISFPCNTFFGTTKDTDDRWDLWDWNRVLFFFWTL